MTIEPWDDDGEDLVDPDNEPDDDDELLTIDDVYIAYGPDGAGGDREIG